MRILIFAIFFFSVCESQSQAWQWAKRGGSNDELDTTSGHRQEEVYSIATDSQKNIYVLSSVGMSGLDIDGVPKTNYGDIITKTDKVLASFSCEGTYRWSKVIGGSGYDELHTVQVDNQDNVYVAGHFGNSSNPTNPHHIDEDVIFPTEPISWQRLIIMKFDNEGVLQWYRKPQHPNVTAVESVNQTTSRGFCVDSSGNSFWLVAIPQGMYADGAFENNLTGTTWHIFKYDAAGNFIDATHIDMQLSGSAALNLEFARNTNGNFIFTGRKTSSESAVVGSQSLEHTAFVFSFGAQGQFLWAKENTSDVTGGIYFFNPTFDSDSNIYLGGRIIGNNGDSFLGFSSSSTTNTAFVIKINSNATSLIWGSNNSTQPLSRGAVVLNGNELGFTNYCFGNNFTWGSQTLNVNGPGEGTEALLARFDKTSGECIALTKIDGNAGFNDIGTALAVDASGDYILGGGFGQQLITNSGSIFNEGPQSDFFVAKYSTETCPPLKVASVQFNEIRIYPNPASNEFFVENAETFAYQIIDYTGRILKRGFISDSSTSINIDDFSNGSYVVKLSDSSGRTTNIKLLRK